MSFSYQWFFIAYLSIFILRTDVILINRVFSNNITYLSHGCRQKILRLPNSPHQLHLYISLEVVAPALVYYTKNCNCLNSHILKNISYDPTNNESKWTFLRTVALKLASFLLIHSFVVMSIRIISQKSSPATHEDPTSIKVINRVISNTLEQSFIFLILLAYFIFDGPGIFLFI